MDDFCTTLAAEMDAELAAPRAVPAFGAPGPVGSMVADAVRQLRAAGVPWLLLLTRVLPVVIDGLLNGKTVQEIVRAVLDAIKSGLFS